MRARVLFTLLGFASAQDIADSSFTQTPENWTVGLRLDFVENQRQPRHLEEEEEDAPPCSEFADPSVEYTECIQVRRSNDMFYTTVLFLYVLIFLTIIGCCCLGIANESFYKNWALCCDEFTCFRESLMKKDPEEWALHQSNKEFKELLKFASLNLHRFIQTRARKNLEIMLNGDDEKS